MGTKDNLIETTQHPAGDAGLEAIHVSIPVPLVVMKGKFFLLSLLSLVLWKPYQSVLFVLEKRKIAEGGKQGRKTVPYVERRNFQLKEVYE